MLHQVSAWLYKQPGCLSGTFSPKHLLSYSFVASSVCLHPSSEVLELVIEVTWKHNCALMVCVWREKLSVSQPSLIESMRLLSTKVSTPSASSWPTAVPVIQKHNDILQPQNHPWARNTPNSATYFAVFWTDLMWTLMPCNIFGLLVTLSFSGGFTFSKLLSHPEKMLYVICSKKKAEKAWLVKKCFRWSGLGRALIWKSFIQCGITSRGRKHWDGLN